MLLISILSIKTSNKKLSIRLIKRFDWEKKKKVMVPTTIKIKYSLNIFQERMVIKAAIKWPQYANNIALL